MRVGRPDHGVRVDGDLGTGDGTIAGADDERRLGRRLEPDRVEQHVGLRGGRRVRRPRHVGEIITAGAAREHGAGMHGARGRIERRPVGERPPGDREQVVALGVGARRRDLEDGAPVVGAEGLGEDAPPLGRDPGEHGREGVRVDGRLARVLHRCKEGHGRPEKRPRVVAFVPLDAPAHEDPVGGRGRHGIDDPLEDPRGRVGRGDRRRDESLGRGRPRRALPASVAIATERETTAPVVVVETAVVALAAPESVRTHAVPCELAIAATSRGRQTRTVASGSRSVNVTTRRANARLDAASARRVTPRAERRTGRCVFT